MTHRVFVYGSLKQGFHNNRVLGNAEFCGSTKTDYARYSMLDLGAFPAVIKSGDHRISGEVYEVDDDGLERLDFLEGNGSLYLREQVALCDGTEAWCYFFLTDNRSCDHYDEVAPVQGVLTWT